jgi:FkbM family methyltransferase
MSASVFAFDRPLGRLVRWPLRLIPHEARMRVLTGPLAGARWIAGAATHGCWLGTYERATQVRFAAAARRARVIYDVGANVGFYTLLGATVVGKTGHVAAFEPLPRNVRYLRAHVELNGCAHVVIVPAAVSDVSGRLAFEDAASASMGRLSDTGGVSVESVTIDELTASGRLPDPDLMKIDVEGAELRVLVGAAATIDRARPVMFLSTHSATLHAACGEWLQAKGYRLERVSDDEIVAFGRYDSRRASDGPGAPTL